MACLLYAAILGVPGCGGPAVEEQERFQEVMNKPIDVSVADQWRAMVAGLKNAVVAGESDAVKYEMESVMEDTDSLNIMKLPEEHRGTGSEIMDKMEELKNTKSKEERKKIIEEMEELADQLPS